MGVGDKSKSLRRKLAHALESGSGASKERVIDLRVRLAKAVSGENDKTTSAAAVVDETLAAVVLDSAADVEDVDKLMRKLARAEKASDEERAVELRSRIAVATAAAAEAAAAVVLAAPLSRKLSRALIAGDKTRAADIRARAAAAKVSLSGGGGADDVAERALWREHGGSGGGGGGGGGAGAPPAPALAPSATVADPHEGMVLAKNGKWYPKPTATPPGNTCLLLFYAYVQPPWTPAARAAAIAFTRDHLEGAGCSGRLRVALEGFNGTLSGPAAGIQSFCAALAAYDPRFFGAIDWKIVEGLPDNKAFRNLKVWPVDDLVNYGFDSTSAPLSMGGTHVTPAKWTELAAAPRTIMIDVRNANESAIGRFNPPPGGALLLDPHMRRSTEFGDWVDNNLEAIKSADKVLMVSE